MSADDDAMAQACMKHVQAALREYRMLVQGDRVLAAISGGPDSVCLLHVLCDLGFTVEVAHFDHQTREGESAADAGFVRALAERLGVPFHLESRPIVEECRDSGFSFEQHARGARYDFLTRTALARQCTAIATGHHADDHVETILMRLLRGTTANGLAGIPPVRLEDGVRIVRPLINCTREEILAYLAARGVSYRIDRSNADTRHVRNRIRHDLLPHLARDYNPQVRTALVRLSESIRCENDFLNAAAERALAECWPAEEGIDRHAFGALHPAVQRRVVLMLVWRHGVDCPFDRVCAAARFIADGPTGARFDLGGGLLIANGRTQTSVAGEHPHPEPAEVILEAPGLTEAFGHKFKVSPLDRSPDKDWAEYCSPFRQVFDADAVGSVLSVRHRRPGDRFVPYGMSGTRKLQDYFVDLGIPVWERDTQLIVLGDDRIAWIVGHAVSGHAAVTARTRRILKIEVMNATG